jgi:hypothetical protein
MKGSVIQEFNNMPFKGNLYPFEVAAGTGSVAEPTAKNLAYWESPRLGTEYVIDGRPKGADRGICKIVNGLISVKFIEKEILDSRKLEVSAALYGEYAGISAVIQQVAFSELFTPFITKMYSSSGALGFPQFSSFSNICQSIFLRVVFRRIDEAAPDEPRIPLPLDVRISGSLIATAPR